MKPDINSVEVHPVVSALLDAALRRWNCSTNESHNGNTWLLCIRDGFKNY
jgi:hypothetical protein